MNLLQVWNSAKAWRAMATLKKPPQVAGQLLRYAQLVNAELAVCERGREALIYEAAGVEPPTPPEVLVVQISENIEVDGNLVPNPQYQAFVAKFNEFLKTDSTLGWIGITLDELIAALAAKEGNYISEDDLLLLEPFFTKPAAIGGE